MGGRVVSLIDFRERRFAECGRATGKGRSVRKSLKSGSHARPIKPRQRLVGSHFDIDSAELDPTFPRIGVGPKQDPKFLLATLLFVGCLVFVAFGL